MIDKIFSLEVIKSFSKSFSEEIDNFYIVGGIIRNSLLGLDSNDVDLCTKYTPTQLLDLCKSKHIKAIETGLDYGTITIILGTTPIEITTLRLDVETYGRKAKVSFSTDIQDDAMRRDFSINALYLDFNKNLYDFHDGIKDLNNKKLRFIGNPDQRIKEDYLRILRLYRFASELDGFTMDPQAENASTALFSNIAGLSSSRIKHEFSRLLSGTNFYPILKLLFEQNLLKHIYNDTLITKISTDRLKNLQFDFNKLIFFCHDSIPVNELLTSLSQTIPLTRKERKLLNDIYKVRKHLKDIPKTKNLNYLLSCYPKTQCLLFLEYAYSIELITLSELTNLNDYANDITVPNFPISGRDLIELGMPPSLKFAEILNKLRTLWSESDYKLSKETLLQTLSTGTDLK